MSTGTREFDKFIDLTSELVVHHYHDLTKDRSFYMELAEERIQESPNDHQA